MDTNVGLRSERQKRSHFSVLSQLLLFLVSHKVLPSSNLCACGTWGQCWRDSMVLKGFSKVTNSTVPCSWC